MNCDWACGVIFEYTDKLIYIICVHLPYDCDDNYDEFIAHLEELKLIIGESITSSIFIVRDFNCDLNRNFVLTDGFKNFLKDSEAILSDDMFMHDAYTYISDSWGTTS